MSQAQKLIDLATTFICSVEKKESFKEIGTIIAASEITPDTVLIFPTEKEDKGELIDNEWACTSNWMYYKVIVEEDKLAKIQLLGTIFEDSNKILAIGQLILIKLPEYLIEACGRTKNAYLADQKITNVRIRSKN